MQTEGLKKATRARKRNAARRRRAKYMLGNGNRGEMRKIFDKCKKACVRKLISCEKTMIGAYECLSKQKLQNSEKELVFALLASAMLGEILRDYERRAKHGQTVKDYLETLFVGKNYAKLRSSNTKRRA